MSEPKFIPKEGQTDFTNARYCPVVNTVVTKDDNILLVQRSSKLRLYPNYWNGVSGFLDDNKSIEEKVREELQDELGINADQITEIKRGTALIQEAPEYSKTWLVIPMLAVITTDKFTLDWEAQKAQWFEPKEALKLNLLPGFNEVLTQFV